MSLQDQLRAEMHDILIESERCWSLALEGRDGKYYYFIHILLLILVLYLILILLGYASNDKLILAASEGRARLKKAMDCSNKQFESNMQCLGHHHHHHNHHHNLHLNHHLNHHHYYYHNHHYY